jgi:diacylglycerol O-acyltransferase / wax synthase
VPPARHGGRILKGSDEVAHVYLNELSDDAVTAGRYETLSAQDQSFLAIEGPALHMHLAVTMVFESGPLSNGAGAVDFASIRSHIAKRLHLIPRYRQRLARGLTREALWVDDEQFDLDNHVRHLRLPTPGDDDMLKALCARIMSRPLDRAWPLWEMWVVEGLQHDRFALINKTHHCMIDGLSGVDVMMALLSLTDEGSDNSVRARRWTPQRPPRVDELLRDRLAQPLGICRAAVRRLREMGRHPWAAAKELRRSATAVSHALTMGLHVAADSPFNRPIGAQRRLEWVSLDLDEVKEVKNRLGGTVNDVVLATVTGALRSFLGDARDDGRLDDLRALAPVSMRSDQEHGALGNRVSAWLVDLPVGEGNPRRRLARLRGQTAELRGSQSARGLEIVSSFGPGTISLAMHLLNWVLPFNLVVTNVPGPQCPLYLLGARLVDIHPHVPLFPNQGLGVALFSYAGKLCWGFSADPDLVPDLPEFRRCVSASFDELLALAREGTMGTLDQRIASVGR